MGKILPVVPLAIIGGSGLAQLGDLKVTEVINPVDLEGPFGQPAGPVTIGEIGGKTAAFLCRHGEHHLISPTNVPYRGNIWALKLLGVEKIFAVSACGSLTEDIQPGILTVPDQLFDYTFFRPGTFFNTNGLVVHISVAKPFCERARQEMLGALRDAGIEYHDGGNYITIEGPQFSTNLAHDIYISWGCHLIGMTTSPEAQLAREAGICYSVLTLPTDIYVTGGKHESVTAEMVVKTFGDNIAKVMKVLPFIISRAEISDCTCHHATENGIQSDQSMMSTAQRSMLATFLEKPKICACGRSLNERGICSNNAMHLF